MCPCDQIAWLGSSGKNHMMKGIDINIIIDKKLNENIDIPLRLYLELIWIIR